MLEPILQLFFRIEIIILVFEIIDLVNNTFSNLIRLAHSEGHWIFIVRKFLVDWFLYAVSTAVYKALEVFMVEIKSFAIPWIFFFST